METQHKQFILITGLSILVLCTAIGIYRLNKKRKEAEDKQAKKKPVPVGKAPISETQTPVTPKLITPEFNGENELSNPMSELYQRTLYPRLKSEGGFGYANIRFSPEVNTDQGWWDFSDNLITTINSGTPIGKVMSETTGVFNGYSYRWFKVKLLKAAGFWSSTWEGFVRADTVTFNPS